MTPPAGMIPQRHYAPNGRVPIAVVLAVLLSSYLTWRPAEDILFTVSDGLFLIGFVQLALMGALPLQPFRVLTVFWLAGFALLVGGLLVGSLASPDPSRWLIVAAQYLFAWVVLPMILLGRGPDATATMLKAFVWGVAAMNLFGALVYFTYTGTFEEARELFGLDFLSGGRRLGAFASDANWNGAVLSMAVPAALFLNARQKVGMVATIATVAILFFGVILSASFTAFVGCIVAVIIFVVVGGVLPRPRSALASAGAMIVLGFVLYKRGVALPSPFVTRVGNAVSSGDIAEAGTFEGRWDLIVEAWQIVERHMLVGLGADQYRVVSALKAPVHNMYLLLWAEGGLLSLAGWIMMMAVLLIAAAKAYSLDRVATALTLSVAINFLIASTASPHMYARLWAVPVLLAVAASLDVAWQRRPAFRRRLPKPVRVEPLGAGL